MRRSRTRSPACRHSATSNQTWGSCWLRCPGSSRRRAGAIPSVVTAAARISAHALENVGQFRLEMEPAVEGQISPGEPTDIPLPSPVEMRIDPGPHQRGDANPVTPDVAGEVGHHAGGSDDAERAGGDLADRAGTGFVADAGGGLAPTFPGAVRRLGASSGWSATPPRARQPRSTQQRAGQRTGDPSGMRTDTLGRPPGAAAH